MAGANEAWSVSAVAVEQANRQFSLERAGTGWHARVVVDIGAMEPGRFGPSGAAAPRMCDGSRTPIP